MLLPSKCAQQTLLLLKNTSPYWLVLSALYCRLFVAYLVSVSNCKITHLF